MKPERPLYTIIVQAMPGIDPVRAIRGALKALKRRYGLRAVSISEQNKPDAFAVAQTTTDRDGRRTRPAGRKAHDLFGTDRRDVGIARPMVNDADVSDVAALALVGLVHQKTDAA